MDFLHGLIACPAAPATSFAAPGASPYTPAVSTANLSAGVTAEQAAAVAQLTQLQAQHPGAEVTTLVGMMGPSAVHLVGLIQQAEQQIVQQFFANVGSTSEQLQALVAAAQSTNQPLASSSAANANKSTSNGLSTKPSDGRRGSADQEQTLDFDYEEVEEAPSQRYFASPCCQKRVDVLGIADFMKCASL